MDMGPGVLTLGGLCSHLFMSELLAEHFPELGPKW